MKAIVQNWKKSLKIVLAMGIPYWEE